MRAEEERHWVLTSAEEQGSGDINEAEGHRNILSEAIERIIYSG